MHIKTVGKEYTIAKAAELSQKESEDISCSSNFKTTTRQSEHSIPIKYKLTVQLASLSLVSVAMSCDGLFSSFVHISFQKREPGNEAIQCGTRVDTIAFLGPARGPVHGCGL